MHDHDRRRGLAMSFAAATLFGVMAFGAKIAAGAVGGPLVALARFTGAAIIVGLVLAVTGRRLRPVAYRPLLVRGVAGGFAVLLYFMAIEHIGVGLATLLNFTSPVFTTLLSRLWLKEPLSARTLTALAVALTGVTMVLLGERGVAHPATFGWLLVGLGSAATSGIAVTAIRVSRQTDGPWEIFAAFTLSGMVCTAPFALPAALPAVPILVLIAGVAAVSVVAQILMTTALKWVDAPTYGVVSQLSVVLAFALGIGFLQERLPPLSVAGSALTIAGVALAAWPRATSSTSPAS